MQSLNLLHYLLGASILDSLSAKNLTSEEKERRFSQEFKSCLEGMKRIGVDDFDAPTKP